MLPIHDSFLIVDVGTTSPNLHVGQGEPIGSVSFPIGIVWLKRVEEDMALETANGHGG